MPENFDLVVIGGGIAGVGVALEAARRNIKVALVEKNECLKATSANSLRIIHSGFRYLQDFSLERVLESTSAQIELQEIGGSYLTPLLCYMPLKRWGLKSKIPLWCASKTYAIYRRALSGEIWRCGVLDSAKVAAEFPALEEVFPDGAFYWEDLIIQQQDAWHQFLLTHLRQRGVNIFEKCAAERITKEQQGWLVETAHADNVKRPFTCKTVVNCVGPGGKQLNPFAQESTREIGWCKAFNLVVSKQLDNARAIALTSPAGRLFFIVPRDRNSVVGTYYTRVDDPESALSLTNEELTAFLTEFNQCLPGWQLTKPEILSHDLGLLPCTLSSAREPKLLHEPGFFARSNYAELVSIKYTTFLTRARNVLSALSLH